jgi:hypothetical protein
MREISRKTAMPPFLSSLLRFLEKSTLNSRTTLFWFRFSNRLGVSHKDGAQI